MSTTNTIRTTRYATQDRFVRVLAAICMLAGLIGAADVLKGL